MILVCGGSSWFNNPPGRRQEGYRPFGYIKFHVRVSQENRVPMMHHEYLMQYRVLPRSRLAKTPDIRAFRTPRTDGGKHCHPYFPTVLCTQPSLPRLYVAPMHREDILETMKDEQPNTKELLTSPFLLYYDGSAWYRSLTVSLSRPSHLE